MITDVTILNFKSIRKIEDLKLKPLTLLTGKNSSGKSNIMEAISFFGQASRMIKYTHQGQSINAVTIFTQNDAKQYPRDIKDYIVYKKNPSNLVSFEINIKGDNMLSIIEDIIKAKFNEIEDILEFQPPIKIKNIGYSIDFRLINNQYRQKILINKDILIEVISSDDMIQQIIYPKNLKGIRTTVHTNNIYNEDVFKLTERTPKRDIFSMIIMKVLSYIKEKTEKIYFISGERGSIAPETRFRDERGPPPTWIGHKSQHLIKILSDCFIRKPEQFRKIVEWAGNFQLNNVRAGYIVNNILESNFRDDQLGIDVNTTLAGLGSRQLLSIITQIFYSEPDDVIMIEEPEISLHPENQVLLHELFADAISEGKQIICSTHSPFFVLALSKIIKKKLLKVDDIAVYHVVKDEDGTDYVELKLNKHGYIDRGVPSFIKIEAELFQDWSESLEEENLKVE